MISTLYIYILKEKRLARHQVSELPAEEVKTSALFPRDKPYGIDDQWPTLVTTI